nr:hypothetical protein [Tanacetum cinerariifolium]
DHRHDHRRDDQCHHQRFAGEVAAGQTDRCQRPEAHGQNGRCRRDDQAVLKRTHPFGRTEEVLTQAAGADQPAIDQVQHDSRQQQQTTQRRRHPPVDAGVGVEGHEVADHLIVRAAEQGRGDVVTNGQDEHQQTACANTGI